MRLSLVTAPAIEPVDLILAKTHLRIELDQSEEDTLLLGYIQTARIAVENDSRRALITSTWDYSIPCWPKGDAIKLPLGNLQNSAVAPSILPIVTWKDTDGTSTTLTVTTDYLVETNGDQCGRIVLPYGGTWPSGTLYPSNPITVRFACGYGDTAESVPWPARAAMLLFLSNEYETRGEDVVGQIFSSVFKERYDSLITKIPRLYDEF